MAIPLAVGGIGIALAGTAMQVNAARQNAIAQKKLAKTNAGVADQNAETQSDLLLRDAQAQERAVVEEREARAFDTRNLRRQERLRRGEEDVRIAASGIQLAGSSLQVAIANAHEAEIAIEAATFPSRQREAVLRDEATLTRFHASDVRRAGQFGLHIGKFQGDVAHRRGQQQIAAAGVSGAGQLLSGASALRAARTPPPSSTPQSGTRG